MAKSKELLALELEVASLRKEVAALKKALSSTGKGGADPRVDKLISYLCSVWGEDSVKAGLK